MTHRRRTALAAGVAAAALLAVGCTGGSPEADLGPTGDEAADDSRGQGIGDPYYPADGNLGYDVRTYLVDLDYHPPHQAIDATTTITALATDRLEAVHFDLTGLRVSDVEVDGKAASFARSGSHELVVTPARPVRDGDRFRVVVRYRGQLGKAPGPGIPNGWFDADTPGAGFIAGEPHSCTVWYPCNDHPTDKAAFELRATVPRPFAVVSNGAELPVTRGRWPSGAKVRTFHWRLDEPTTTYLTTMYVDHIDFARSTLEDGTPVVSAFGSKSRADRALDGRLPEMLDLLEDYWGPYPAPQAGGIYVTGDVPFSLETYTRPIYADGVDASTVVHELGHQWWGDNVSIEGWRDICLSECLASYSGTFLWSEHTDVGTDLDDYYRSVMEDSPGFLDVPLYDMGPGHEFDRDGVYVKGPFFIHALRNKIGDDAFFSAMQEIQTEHAVGNLSMLGLRDELQAKTGVDLESFWDEWVLSTGVPSDDNLYPGDLAD